MSISITLRESTEQDLDKRIRDYFRTFSANSFGTVLKSRGFDANNNVWIASLKRKSLEPTANSYLI